MKLKYCGRLVYACSEKLFPPHNNNHPNNNNLQSYTALGPDGFAAGKNNNSTDIEYFFPWASLGHSAI